MSRFTKKTLAGVLVASSVVGAGATGAAADRGGNPNQNSCWGQFVGAGAQIGPSAPGVGGFVRELGPGNVDDFVRWVKGGGVVDTGSGPESPCATNGF